MCHHCESVAWLVCTVITDSYPFTCPAPGPGSTEPMMEPTVPFVVQANVRLRVPLVPQSVHARLRPCACALEATSASAAVTPRMRESRSHRFMIEIPHRYVSRDPSDRSLPKTPRHE